MKIGIFTDPHSSDMTVTCNNRYPSLSYEKIKAAMQDYKENDVELVICLGDLLNRCVDRTNDEKEFIRLAEMIRSFGIPFYCIMGNHDCEIFSEDDFYRIGGFSALPFSKLVDNKALIFLDACYHDDGERYSSSRSEWTNSFVSCDQINQLKSILDNPQVDEVIVFLHQLLNPDADPRYLVKNACEIRAVLENSNKVRSVYSGHYHRGQYSSCNGISYNVMPAMCIGEENRFFIIEI